MLGSDLLVAPVFCAEGDVAYYVPDGRWTDLLRGNVVDGPRWVRERHGFDSVPLLVRPGAVIPMGARDDRPDYDYAAGVSGRCSRDHRARRPIASGAVSRSRLGCAQLFQESHADAPTRVAEGSQVSVVQAQMRSEN